MFYESIATKFVVLAKGLLKSGLGATPQKSPIMEPSRDDAILTWVEIGK